MMIGEVMQRADTNDSELVAESLSGNRDSFRLIVERYQTLIASLAYCATGDVSRSEDLAQETFVAAWKQLADLREPAKLRSWLCSIARSRINRDFRRQEREPDQAAESPEAMEEWVAPEPPPLDQVINDEEKAILWRSLERIPETYREPLVLFYREHQSIEAVAQDLGLSQDAVKQRLSRGRKLLQEQFLAFVAGALKQTRPGKAFTIAVIAALPLLTTTAKAATVGTAIAKHGSVAAKATGFVGFLQAVGNLVMGMVGWVAGALSLGGYIGYKMGGDRLNGEQARRSVATFWGMIAVSMLLCFVLLPLGIILHYRGTPFSEAKVYAILGFCLNVCLPIFMLGLAPLSLVLWIWRRKQQIVPQRPFGGPISRSSPKFVIIWAALAMTIALINLGFFCWISSHSSASRFPAPLSLSTSEIQSYIANSQVRKLRFKLFQNASGARTLHGDLWEQTGKVFPFVAPAEKSTLALLAENGIGYDTKIENRDTPRFNITRAGEWSSLLLSPFCWFILVSGAVTLVRGSHNRQSELNSPTDLRTERRVDKAFAALAACGMVALALFRGVTTDWKVHTLSADQVPAVVAQHKEARFEVYEYMDGSRKLWISDLRNPDFIAPADQSTLEVLDRQEIRYQTYVASIDSLPAPGQRSSILWILALTGGAACLVGWAVKSRSVAAPYSEHPDTI